MLDYSKYPLSDRYYSGAEKKINEGLITVEEAMSRTGIKSRSTFYRKLRKFNQ